MVSWNDSATSSSYGESITSPAPAIISCSEWSGLATELGARCEHQAVCEKLVSFESVDSGRRFLGCGQKEGSKCNYVQWVDPECPPQLKMALGNIWDLYEDENKLRLRQNVVNAEENFKILKEKEKMEKDLRFFKVDFAKMVADKEQSLEQLGSTQIALTDLKAELEKKKISDKPATNIHQVVRAKAEKERDLMKQERDQFMDHNGKLVQERDNLVLERDQLNQENKKLEYMIGDLFKHKEDTRCKIMKMKEILDEFE